ncbi:MAG: DUF4911 domain-containing protein [Synergistetes bacterium]|nr:DUF4911 domain-containing protein [Synergistota bacterium]
MNAENRVDTIDLFFRTQRQHIFYVAIIFEAYEGIAITQTVDKDIAIIRVMVAPDFIDDVMAVVSALREEGIELKKVNVNERVVGEGN